MAAASKANGEKTSGAGGALIPFLLLTLLGAGLGIGFKLYFLSPVKPEIKAAAERAEPVQQAANSNDHHKKTVAGAAHGAEAVQSGEEKQIEHGAGAGEPFLVSVDPVVTTLAEGPPSWVRLEVSLIFKRQPKEKLKTVVAEVSSDFVAYLRTVKASQIEGAEGLEYLTDDLNDIVRVRTHGAADRLVIKGLVFE